MLAYIVCMYVCMHVCIMYVCIVTYDFINQSLDVLLRSLLYTKKYAPPKEQCSLPNSRAAKVTGKNKTNLSFARPSSPAILKPLGLLRTHVVV